MTEFPIDVLWVIKSMFIRSIWNPNALKYTINGLIDAYKSIIIMIFLWVIICFIVKYIFKIIKTVKEHNNNNDKLLQKQDLKEVFSKEKRIFIILKYPIIWGILISTCWTQVSLLFRLFSKYYETQTDIIRGVLPAQESWILWMWPTYSLWIFIIAWCFIWLSFWNKMLRNVWILIYALWIIFILFAHFLNNWFITNWLENFVI